MRIEVWIEPVYSNSQWCRNLLDGIRRGAKIRHLEVSCFVTAEPRQISDVSSTGVILTGETHTWFRTMIDYCNHNEIRCCVPSNSFLEGENISIVHCDYLQISQRMVRYLYDAGKRRIALFGINTSSPSDMVRHRGYLEAVHNLRLDLSENDVFYTDGNITNSCRQFVLSHDRYDAVIVSNNLYAVYFIGSLKREGIRVPEDLYVSSFGNTRLSRISKPSITSMADSLNSIGYQTIVCMDILMHDNSISRLSMVVPADTFLGGSTNYFPFPDTKAKIISEPQVSVIHSTNDAEISRISNLESCLVDADRTDMKLIYALASENLTKVELAEKLYLSEGALNYRTDKLIKKTGFANRAELIAALRGYSEFIDFSILLDANSSATGR